MSRPLRTAARASSSLAKPSPLTSPAARMRGCGSVTPPTLVGRSGKAARLSQSRQAASSSRLPSARRMARHGAGMARPGRRGRGPRGRRDARPRRWRSGPSRPRSGPCQVDRCRAARMTCSPSKATAPRMRTSRTRPQTRMPGERRPARARQEGSVLHDPGGVRVDERERLGRRPQRRRCAAGRWPRAPRAAPRESRPSRTASTSSGSVVSRPGRPYGGERSSPSRRACAARGRSRRRPPCRRATPSQRASTSASVLSGRLDAGRRDPVGPHRPRSGRGGAGVTPTLMGRPSRLASRSIAISARAADVAEVDAHAQLPHEGQDRLHAWRPRHGRPRASVAGRLPGRQVAPTQLVVSEEQVAGGLVAVHLEAHGSRQRQPRTRPRRRAGRRPGRARRRSAPAPRRSAALAASRAPRRGRAAACWACPGRPSSHPPGPPPSPARRSPCGTSRGPEGARADRPRPGSAAGVTPRRRGPPPAGPCARTCRSASGGSRRCAGRRRGRRGRPPCPSRACAAAGA